MQVLTTRYWYPKKHMTSPNAADVKRCWSHANVRGLSPSENQTKSWTIVDELCTHAGLVTLDIRYGLLRP